MEAGAEGHEFLDLTEDLFLHQHVRESTRNANTLDLILTSNPDQVRTIIVSEQFGSSDHNIVHFELFVDEIPSEGIEGNIQRLP